MNTSAHSPLPWRVSTNYGVAHHVCSDTGLIAVCDAGDYARSRLEGAANAALIVSSVNAHASLVERVKELEEALRGILDLDVVEKDLGDSRDPRTVIARAAIAAPRETTKES